MRTSTLDDEARWRQVEARDHTVDGQFYYSVKTTGVDCRPSCAARLARRENVGFHASCEDAEQARFCITIDMGRYNFGQDEYKYFSYPLPDGVAELRAAFYAPLSPLANRWNAAMGMEARYPATHAAWG